MGNRCTQSCIFVIPRPATFHKFIAIGRRLKLFFLVSFQKLVKFHPLSSFYQWIWLRPLVPPETHLVSFFSQTSGATTCFGLSPTGQGFSFLHYLTLLVHEDIFLFLEVQLCILGFGFLFLYFTCHCFFTCEKFCKRYMFSFCFQLFHLFPGNQSFI